TSGSNGSRKVSSCASYKSFSSSTDAASSTLSASYKTMPIYRKRPTHVSEQIVGFPFSSRRKQNIHFSCLCIFQLNYTFSYVQPVMQKRPLRHVSCSTKTMPSSSRLYIAPDGQEDTHDEFLQCSQIRGKC